ncbi:uncharacterized protein [Dermacentor andersoni]|uniref:uncharacterized protein n=1 Tax=Dermacentor andersoni TaxID=34620 RepID=UPI0024169B58|nr:uncharacterized protein LOC129380530 [Dermacentor andersoni]XP_054917770.1 uncharacterized protein LOC129380530 [Dermacentor andersoni]XP_054917771.1 uncharacterized protein LOC129380530 [Dermacentor andersoni]XP_054917772.1 uncharacterized protein LOC129380530 [Dermacentor andersoni]
MANTSGKPIEGEKEDLNDHEVLNTLYLEASKTQAQMHELQALQEFKYLKPSEIEKQKDKMDAAVNKLAALEKQLKERQEQEGTDIVVNKKWAKDCKSLALLVRDIVECEKAPIASSGSSNPKDLEDLMREQNERLSRAADAIDADIKELQQRIERLGS